MTRIIPLVALIVGAAVALIPWAQDALWVADCEAHVGVDWTLLPGYTCQSYATDPRWATGLVAGLVTYFVLVGIVVAQRALKEPNKN